MKPKAPKKKDIKPSAKSGEVREDKVIEHITLNLDWTDKTEFPTYYIMLDIRKIREIEDKFYSWD